MALPSWLPGTAEAIGRGAAALLRSPEFRIQSHERRAAFWHRRALVLQAKARMFLRQGEAVAGKRKERLEAKANRLYERSVKAFARYDHHTQMARELARTYGLSVEPDEADTDRIELK